MLVDRSKMASVNWNCGVSFSFFFFFAKICYMDI